MQIPTAPSDITASWLSEVLLASGAATGAIDGCRITDIGEGTGIFGEIARVDVDYVTAAGGPPSVIVKLPCSEPENLAVAQALGIYEREIRFFRDVAPSTKLRIPACHLAELGDDGRFVLVLEDLSAGFELGDQVQGASLAQARAAIDALADLHIRWWERDELSELDWLPVPNAPAYLAAVPEIYRGGVPVLEAEWADRVPAELVDVARRLGPRFEDLMHMIAGGPRTFTHGDTRLDNVFFAPDGGVAFIDFQLSLQARGAADLAYLIGTSVPRDVAANNWEDLVRGWHAKLVEAGISYPWDDAVTHYKQWVLYYLVGGMSLIASFDTGNERGAALTEAYLTRIAHHIIDVDAAATVLD